MGNEQWYVLKVRPGFAAVAAQKLRKLKFEVFVPESKPIRSQEPHQMTEYVYCRFDFQQHRESVMTVPGVLDILGIPQPTAADEDFTLLRLATRL